MTRLQYLFLGTIAPLLQGLGVWLAFNERGYFGIGGEWVIMPLFVGIMYALNKKD